MSNIKTPAEPFATRAVSPATARYLWNGHDICRSGREQGAHTCPADRALQHGRYSH